MTIHERLLALEHKQHQHEMKHRAVDAYHELQLSLAWAIFRVAGHSWDEEKRAEYKAVLDELDPEGKWEHPKQHIESTDDDDYESESKLIRNLKRAIELEKQEKEASIFNNVKEIT